MACALLYWALGDRCTMCNSQSYSDDNNSSSPSIAPFSSSHKLDENPQQQQQQQQQQQSTESLVHHQNNSLDSSAKKTDDGKKKTPIWCACPTETRIRDECIILKGEENCTEQIESFCTCLLSEGFTQEQVDSLRKRARQ